MRIRARTKVLDYVSQHPGAGAAQIARALGSKPPAVRHHLSILKSDGRIEVVSRMPGLGRGRPKMGYRVADVLSGNNLAMLAEHLLSARQDNAGASGRKPALVLELAKRLGQRIQPSQVGSGAARRLASLVEHLNELHYRSRWEAGAEGPRLIFGHCPYASVVEQHPELCQMDALAVGAIMNASVRQESKIDPRGAGSPACVLALKYR